MKKPKNIGAINPYALTEILVGRKINWGDPMSIHLIEEVLETDYSKLFDPKFDSPLYAGLSINDEGSLEPIDNKNIEIRDDSDYIDMDPIERFDDLNMFGYEDLQNLEIVSNYLERGNLNLSLKTPTLDNTITNKRVSKLLKEVALPFKEANKNEEWIPDFVKWMDKGDFFEDVSEYDDPIQGAVGNCYFIAALSSVVWSQPYLITHKIRPTGEGDTDRTNLIKFYNKGDYDPPTKEIEVTDKLPVSSRNGNYIYCRSNDYNEIWPAIYEKAFAKWITGNTTDKPNIKETAFGDTVKAMAQLCGRDSQYYWTNDISDDRCYYLVRSNSRGGKTFNPMTAWTSDSSDFYRGSSIAANHAYSILGWAYHNNQKYIVLRNPWGVFEPTGLTTYQGYYSAYNLSFWKYINLINNDGVFALTAESFKKYFAGFGVVK